MIKRAQRLEGIVGFGIDRVAASSEEKGGSHGGPILRMENLDTDLPLPPEALEVTRAKLDDPKSNSWLPFTGDLDLRAAIHDFTAERTGHRYDPEREIVITAAPRTAPEKVVPVPIASAVADAEQENFPVGAAFDGVIAKRNEPR